MKAHKILDLKLPHAKGIVQMRIWQLPESTTERLHGLKYSLVYIVNGERVVGYDNELGKGDHKHVQGKELSYQFAGVDQLIADFKADIERLT